MVFVSLGLREGQGQFCGLDRDDELNLLIKYSIDVLWAESEVSDALHRRRLR